MSRRFAQLILVPLFLASCTSLDSYLPWVQTSSFKGSKAAARVAEASIAKAVPTDPEYQVDPWSFILKVRNKTGIPRGIQYKVVFMDSHSVPTDVQYGQVQFQTEWTELRKSLVPQAESSKAQVYLYLLEEPAESPAPIASRTPYLLGGGISTPSPGLYPIGTPVPLPTTPPTPVPSATP